MDKIKIPLVPDSVSYKTSQTTFNKSALHLMQLHHGQEPMITAPKLTPMNIHLNLTNVRTSAWNKTCADYSDLLYDWCLQNPRLIGHRTERYHPNFVGWK